MRNQIRLRIYKIISKDSLVQNMKNKPKSVCDKQRDGIYHFGELAGESRNPRNLQHFPARLNEVFGGLLHLYVWQMEPRNCYAMGFGLR